MLKFIYPFQFMLRFFFLSVLLLSKSKKISSIGLGLTNHTRPQNIFGWAIVVGQRKWRKHKIGTTKCKERSINRRRIWQKRRRIWEKKNVKSSQTCLIITMQRCTIQYIYGFSHVYSCMNESRTSPRRHQQRCSRFGHCPLVWMHLLFLFFLILAYTLDQIIRMMLCTCCVYNTLIYLILYLLCSINSQLHTKRRYATIGETQKYIYYTYNKKKGCCISTNAYTAYAFCVYPLNNKTCVRLCAVCVCVCVLYKNIYASGKKNIKKKQGNTKPSY